MIDSFNATFVVPPVPTSFDSQIIFLSANIQVLDANGVPFGNLRAALQVCEILTCANPTEHKFSTEAVLFRAPVRSGHTRSNSRFLATDTCRLPIPGLR
jgi:hypothetical protein